MRWQGSLATVAIALTVAVPSEADIFLDVGPPNILDCGLASYRIRAVATEGELIAGFDGIRLTNAHQVYRLGDDDTPNIDDIGGFAWNDVWTAYDSHILIPRADMLGTVGAPLEETNDGSTTGMVGLPREFGMSPQSGFGNLASSNGTDGFRLRPSLQTSSVEFLQVVTPLRGTAFLEHLTVAASLHGSPISEEFVPIDFGFGALEPPPDGSHPPMSHENCIVPEPASIVLVAIAGLFLAGRVCRDNSVSKGGKSSCVGESR